MSVGAHWTHIVMRATQSKSLDAAEDDTLTAAIERLAQTVFQSNGHSSIRSAHETARMGKDWTRVLVEAFQSVPPNPADLLRFRIAVQRICEVLFGFNASLSSSNASHLSAEAAATSSGHSQRLQEEDTGNAELGNSQSGSRAGMETHNPAPQQPSEETSNTDIQVNPALPKPAQSSSDDGMARSLTTTIPTPTSLAPSAVSAAEYFWNGGSAYPNSANDLNALSIPDAAFDALSYSNAFFGGIAPTQLELLPKTPSAATGWPTQTRTVLAPLQNTATKESDVRHDTQLENKSPTGVYHSPASAKCSSPSTQSSPSKIKSTTSQKGRQIKPPAAKLRKRKSRIVPATLVPNKPGNNAIKTVEQTPRAGCKRSASPPANTVSGAELVLQMFKEKEILGEPVQISQICRIMQYRVGKKGGIVDKTLNDFIKKDRRDLFHSSARKYLSRSHMMMLELSRFIHIGCRREVIDKDGDEEYRISIFLPDSVNPYYEEEQEQLGWDASMELFSESDDEETSTNNDEGGAEV